MRLILNFTPIEKWIPYGNKLRWPFLRPSCLSWKPPLVSSVLVGVSRSPWVCLGFSGALLVLLWTLAAQALPGNPQARLDLLHVCSCLAPLWCSNKCFESLSCQVWGGSARMAGQGQPGETGALPQLPVDTWGRTGRIVTTAIKYTLSTSAHVWCGFLGGLIRVNFTFICCFGFSGGFFSIILVVPRAEQSQHWKTTSFAD